MTQQLQEGQQQQCQMTKLYFSPLNHQVYIPPIGSWNCLNILLLITLCSCSSCVCVCVCICVVL